MTCLFELAQAQSPRLSPRLREFSRGVCRAATRITERGLGFGGADRWQGPEDMQGSDHTTLLVTPRAGPGLSSPVGPQSAPSAGTHKWKVIRTWSLIRSCSELQPGLAPEQIARGILWP